MHLAKAAPGLRRSESHQLQAQKLKYGIEANKLELESINVSVIR